MTAASGSNNSEYEIPKTIARLQALLRFPVSQDWPRW